MIYSGGCAVSSGCHGCFRKKGRKFGELGEMLLIPALNERNGWANFPVLGLVSKRHC